MNPIVNTVPPRIDRVVDLEEFFKDGGGIARTGYPDRAFVDHEWPSWIIRNEAVVLELIGAGPAFSHPLFRVFRTPPSDSFLCDTFEVVDQAHLTIPSKRSPTDFKRLSKAAVPEIQAHL